MLEANESFLRIFNNFADLYTMGSDFSAIVFPGNKLSSSELDSLRPIPIKAFRPAQLTLGPVYVYLKKNKKIIAIKSALNIFTERELEKYLSYRTLYIPQSIVSIEQFIQSAKLVRTVLTSSESVRLSKDGASQKLSFPIHPTSLSRLVYDSIKSLFKEKDALDAYSLVFFTNTLCGEPPSSWLLSSFEEDVDAAQLSLLRASLSVVVDLFSGYTDLEYLTHKRNRLLDLDDSSVGKFLIPDYSKQYFQFQELSKMDHPSIQAMLSRMQAAEVLDE